MTGDTNTIDASTGKYLRDKYAIIGVGETPYLRGGGRTTRYMATTAVEKVQDAHNFALEVWATSGVFALLVLLLTLGSFFRQVMEVVAARASAFEAADRIPNCHHICRLIRKGDLKPEASK